MKHASLISIAETQQQAGEVEEESDLEDTNPPSTCASYIKAKQQRKIIKKLVERTTQPFELIYSDLCGPISPPSLIGAPILPYISTTSSAAHGFTCFAQNH